VVFYLVWPRNAGAEEKLVSCSAIATIAKPQPPQSLNRDRVSVAVELSKKSPGCYIEYVDAPVAKIPNQQIVAKRTKIAPRPPWSLPARPGSSA
jgi:hypothetical protein